MKKRMGFVSNSSSSSFCILGYCVGNKELKRNFSSSNEEMQEKILKYAKEYFSDFEGNDWEDALSLIFEDSLEEFLYNLKINVEYDWENDCAYIGLSPNAMKAEETRTEFEERVKKEVSSIYKIADKKPTFIIETIYN